MKQILFILCLFTVYTLSTTVTSCNLIPAIAPEDWVYNPPAPVVVDTTDTDTIIPVDTLPIIVVDTPCVPVLVTEPKFVTLYIEFDILENIILWQGGQVESNNLAEVVAAVTSLPFTIYNEGKSWVVIIEGTNDNQAFYLKIFARSNGAKIYMGSIMQGFIFAGALTFPEYHEAAIKYQSVDRFNYRNCPYTEEQLITLSYTIKHGCKIGRTWSDFRWWNGGTVPDSIPLAFIANGWNTVLHATESDCKMDLRGQRIVSIESILGMVGNCQVIMDDDRK